MLAIKNNDIYKKKKYFGKQLHNFYLKIDFDRKKKADDSPIIGTFCITVGVGVHFFYKL